MATHQITHIRATGDTLISITHVRGVTEDGENFTSSVDEVVEGICHGDEYHLQVDGIWSVVSFETDAYGKHSLKSTPRLFD